MGPTHQPVRERGLEPEVDAELIAEVLRLTEEPAPPALPRHRHGLTRDEVTTAQRARIIVATAQVVTEVGYAAASTRAIIERAGVSSKTFYAFHRDKESAFLAAFTLLDGLVVARARTPVTPAEDPRAQLHDGVGAFLELLARWPLFTQLHAVEARAAGPRVLERRSAVFREFVAALGAAIRAAAEVDGRIDVPDDAVLMGVVGGIGELVLQHVVQEGAESLPSLQPTIVALLERVTRPPAR